MRPGPPRYARQRPSPSLSTSQPLQHLISRPALLLAAVALLAASAVVQADGGAVGEHLVAQQQVASPPASWRHRMERADEPPSSDVNGQVAGSSSRHRSPSSIVSEYLTHVAAGGGSLSSSTKASFAPSGRPEISPETEVRDDFSSKVASTTVSSYASDVGVKVGSAAETSSSAPVDTQETPNRDFDYFSVTATPAGGEGPPLRGGPSPAAEIDERRNRSMKRLENSVDDSQNISLESEFDSSRYYLDPRQEGQSRYLAQERDERGPPERRAQHPNTKEGVLPFDDAVASSSTSEGSNCGPRTLIPTEQYNEASKCRGRRELSSSSPRKVHNITVGYLTAIKGEMNDRQGLAISGAISYALEEINNREDILPGVHLSMEWEDGQGDPVTSTRFITNMICKGVSAFFGPEGKCDVEAIISQANNRPMISY
ncbi:hypothetical protein J437_LFUL012579, partial [Ladona fulva]